MGNHNSRDVGVCDPRIEEADADSVNYDDGVSTVGGHVGYKTITVRVAELSTVSAFRGPGVDENEACAGIGVNAWIAVGEVPTKVRSV
jgi:hypothetical protein